MNMINPLLCLLAGILLVGCSDKKEPEVYTTQKTSTSEKAGLSPVPFVESGEVATPPEDMMSQVLDPDAVNTAGTSPEWIVPGEWETSEGSSVRRASFSASGTAGPVDISVTSFPGDVGGLLANLNRWRNQIGLSPIDASELEESVEHVEVNGKTAIITDMTGPEQSTMAAVFGHAGQSWFFKMTGPTASIEEQESAFLSFVKSIQFPVDD